MGRLLRPVGIDLNQKSIEPEPTDYYPLRCEPYCFSNKLKSALEIPLIRWRIQEEVGFFKRPKVPRVPNVKPNEIDKIELKLEAVRARAIRLFSRVNVGISVLTKMLQKLSVEGVLLEQERASLNDLVIISLTMSGQCFQSTP